MIQNSAYRPTQFKRVYASDCYHKYDLICKLWTVIIKDNYIGGILAPGVNLSLSTLSDKASLIPKIKLEKAKSIIGKNTISAIRAGFYHGYEGLIDNIIKMIIKQTGKSFNIILTGGYSHLFKNSIKKKTIINKNLTINGVLKDATLSK